MEVSTQADYKLPTEGIAILNYFQSPNKFSQMEICLYPYFLSLGDDMCFTHYESSPFLYTKAKKAQNVVRTGIPGFCSCYKMNDKENSHIKTVYI